MTFIASKLFWFVAQPLGLLLTLQTLALILTLAGSRKAGLRLFCGLGILMLAVFLLPVGHWITRPLEARFPEVTVLPEKVDGIIVLGGSMGLALTEAFGQPALNSAAERLTEFVALARHYPRAKLVFTGGSAQIFPGRIREADVARQVFEQVGLDTGRVIFERNSRNTFENAVFTRGIVHPEPGEHWLLVTSAIHMPRTVGIFRQTGWPVSAYPVDYRTLPKGGTNDVTDNLDMMTASLREWIGLVAYRLLGRTDALFPAP
ncbi:YdcF family protein [Radicibacter daui]|uniref:YdcF family protein n=1 Tax=Radicibacter daui TaxID=3064829 RepID=UPI004046B692